MTVKEVLKSTKDSLRHAGTDTWSLDADLLVMEALGLSRIQLVTRDTDEAGTEQLEVLDKLLKRRLENEPMQYILGRCEFMGLEYRVSPNVLIPRPDTEILVEEVLKHKPASALDIGTGSGAIAVALARYGVKDVTAADVSAAVLETARANAELNGVSVSFLHSDLFENVSGTFDAVVSNPPYIASKVIPALDAQVKDYEPHLALDGGADGLDFYRRMTGRAQAYLNNGGLLAFEIGYDQGAAVSELMRRHGFSEVRVIKDLAGLDRVVTGIVQGGAY